MQSAKKNSAMMPGHRRHRQQELSVGTIVSACEDERIMVVEAIETTAFGRGLRCVWFGRDDGLRF